MNEMNSTQQRESNDSDVFYEESHEGSYETYRNKNLPEGYTAYKEIRHVGELVYDRYSSVYSDDSVHEKKLRKKFCFKKGLVFNFTMKIFNFLKQPCSRILIGKK